MFLELGVLKLFLNMFIRLVTIAVAEKLGQMFYRIVPPAFN